jgi:hypothetical protein
MQRSGFESDFDRLRMGIWRKFPDIAHLARINQDLILVSTSCYLVRARSGRCPFRPYQDADYQDSTCCSPRADLVRARSGRLPHFVRTRTWLAYRHPITLTHLYGAVITFGKT